MADPALEEFQFKLYTLLEKGDGSLIRWHRQGFEVCALYCRTPSPLLSSNVLYKQCYTVLLLYKQRVGRFMFEPLFCAIWWVCCVFRASPGRI